MKNNIKYLVMDVDGTLTDGKIYMGEHGEAFKAFCAKDGCGIKTLLPQAGIQPVIITSRESGIVSNRCLELGINMLYQGVQDKVVMLNTIAGQLGASLSDFAYIGDDLNDLACIQLIRKHGGYTACPADAASDILDIVDFVCKHKGGDGAVREFISHILR